MSIRISSNLPTSNGWRTPGACTGIALGLGLSFIGGGIFLFVAQPSSIGTIGNSFITGGGAALCAISFMLGCAAFVRREEKESGPEERERERILKFSRRSYTEEEAVGFLIGPSRQQIVEGLYLGNEMAAGGGYFHAKGELDAEGIDHILCCIPEPQELPEHQREPFLSGMVFKRFPFGDLPSEHVKFYKGLPEAIRYIEDGRKQGHKILVHCNAGSSRSASVVAGYLMWKYNLTFEEATGYIKNIRPCVDFTNFKKALIDFEQDLNEKKLILYF